MTKPIAAIISNVSIDNFIKVSNYAAIISDNPIMRQRGVEFILYKPNYEIFAATAPLQCYKDMINACDIFFVFWNGMSQDIKSAIDYAVSLNRKTRIYIIEERD